MWNGQWGKWIYLRNNIIMSLVLSFFFSRKFIIYCFDKSALGNHPFACCPLFLFPSTPLRLIPPISLSLSLSLLFSLSLSLSLSFSLSLSLSFSVVYIDCFYMVTGFFVICEKHDFTQAQYGMGSKQLSHVFSAYIHRFYVILERIELPVPNFFIIMVSIPIDISQNHVIVSWTVIESIFWISPLFRKVMCCLIYVSREIGPVHTFS